jgi:transposase
MTSFAKTNRISQTFTPYYSPQANPTERVNSVIKSMISSYLGKHQSDWDISLLEFAYALNTSVHSATVYASLLKPGETAKTT